MRPRAMVFWLSLSVSAVLTAQTAVLEGVVADQESGEPLSETHVRLVRGDLQRPSAVLGAMTDRSGRFAITAIPSGQYVLVLERPGFVPADTALDSPSAGLNVVEGQHLQLTLKMIRRAVLSGLVVDEFGDPVRSVRVRALAPGPGAAALVTAPDAVTNDEGEFRIPVPPGRYTLQALPERIVNPGGVPPEVRTDGTFEMIPQVTFYPGTATRGDAVEVNAIAGSEVRGLRIPLAYASRRSAGHTISGTVRGIPGGAECTVYLVAQGNAAAQAKTRTTTVRGTGQFTVSGLAAGIYEVFARSSQASQHLYARSILLHAGVDDTSNVEVQLYLAGRVSGSVEFAGKPAERSVRQLVRFVPSSYTPYGDWNSTAEIDAKGAFSLDGIPPGMYSLRLDPMPAGAYVRSLTANGSATSDQVTDLSRPVADVRVNVLVSLSAARLSGKIYDGGGKEYSGEDVTAVLLSDPEHFLSAYTARSVGGSYTIGGIRPGRYRLFAVRSQRLSSPIGQGFNRDVLAIAYSLGKELTLSDNDTISVDLTIVPDEALSRRTP